MEQHPTLRHTAIKTVFYRLISWTTTTVLAWLIIGHAVEVEVLSPNKAVVVFGVVDMVMNTVVYFWYDQIYAMYTSWILIKDYRSDEYWEKRRATLMSRFLGMLLLLPAVFGLVLLILYLWIYI